jgi:hypothetical protein
LNFLMLNVVGCIVNARLWRVNVPDIKIKNIHSLVTRYPV